MIWDVELETQLVCDAAETSFNTLNFNSSDDDGLILFDDDDGLIFDDDGLIFDDEMGNESGVNPNAEKSEQGCKAMMQDGTVWALSWSPDGKRIVSASEDTTVCVWDARR